ncbi:hypothetical protein [Marinicella sp. W31]|uniref:hypothetical protein n=1 Tax=Marinicella sp. W31 TaxID=3023713 RepID=UPI003757130B
MSDTTPNWTFCADSTLQVNSVAISDDGSSCVFGTSNEFGKGKFSTYLYSVAKNTVGKWEGTQTWEKPVSTEKEKQGIFWTAISGDGHYIASGGENSGSNGFLLAYDQAGTCLLDSALNSRINQVSLSQDGTYMAACYGNVLEIFKLHIDATDSSKTKYKSIGKETLTYDTDNKNIDIYSCEISRDGKTVVACGKIFVDKNNHHEQDAGKQDKDQEMKGKVFCFTVSDDDSVSETGSCKLYTGALRVAIVDSGLFWAVALHDGSCMLFHRDNADRWEWHYEADFTGLKLAYAIDVTQTDEDDIYVACGANVDGQSYGGILYMLKSKKHGDDHGHDYYYKPELKWKATTTLPINPGVSMDLNAQYVTATVGKPKPGSSHESAGAFYLFAGDGGIEQWKYDTKLMNWPMMLSRDGSSVFGGSDDGSVYYWKLSD